MSNTLRKSSGYLLILIAVIFGFFSRVVSVFHYTTFDIGPDPDQVRDAFTYMKMWQGELPHLGPSVSIGEYQLPPLYYYIVFPFTALGANPAFQALANAVFSFLSIILLIYLVYLLLEGVEPSKRFFLSGLAGVWYSLIFPDIFISTFNWNPSPIPFFLIAFTLLYNYQIKSKSTSWQAVSWFFYGIVLAILVSLHSSTLFIMPIIFLGSCLWFIYKKRQWYFPAIAVLSANLALIPYWKLETSRNFINTKKIINTVLFPGQNGDNNILNRLISMPLSYIELGQQAYFIGEDKLYLIISAFFLLITLALGLINFKGNKVILGFLLGTWGIFIYAASRFEGEHFFIHYKLLILFAPIIFAVLSLAYLSPSKFSRVAGTVIALGIAFSMLTNLKYDIKYLSSKYGSTRLVSVGSVINTFSTIPENSTICDPAKQGKRIEYNLYRYIDLYITQKNFQVVSDCPPGSYLLHSKYVLDQQINNLWPVFDVSRNDSFQQKAKLFMETPELNVYVLK